MLATQAKSRRKKGGRPPLIPRETPWASLKEKAVAEVAVRQTVREVTRRYKLAPKQARWLTHWALGEANAGIQRRTKTSQSTVAKHGKAVYRKIGVHRGTQLVPVLLLAHERALERLRSLAAI